MKPTDIALWRMRNVGLIGPPAPGYAAAIGGLGAVQAQDFGLARWSIGARTDESDSVIGHAFSAGSVLRTHVLRPTWHFVLPADLHWLLKLTAPRVHALNRYYYRQEGLDDELRARSAGLIADALRGENHLTKGDIAVLLERAGAPSSGNGLSYLMLNAELEGLICSGPLRGKQQTYALVDERVPVVAELSRETALAELTRRYFTSHGPATVNDFKWWSSLLLADVTLGLELAGDVLRTEVIDGTPYWYADSAPPPVPDSQPSSPMVHLVQAYDEYVVGYTESKHLMDVGGAVGSSRRDRPIFRHIILLDGQLAGYWRRAIAGPVVQFEAVLDSPFTPEQHQALQAEADRQAEFLGLTAELTAFTAEASANQGASAPRSSDARSVDARPAGPRSVDARPCFPANRIRGRV